MVWQFFIKMHYLWSCFWIQKDRFHGGKIAYSRFNARVAATPAVVVIAGDGGGSEDNDDDDDHDNYDTKKITFDLW